MLRETMERQMRLTDLSIKTLEAPEKGAIVYPDSVLTGFGVRISEGGTKSFVLTHGKLRKRETIGRVGVLTLQDARTEAKRRLAEYTLGKTVPRPVAWNMAVTIYLEEVRRRLKPRTHADYKRFLGKYFRFGELAVSEVTPDDIQTRLARLAGTPVEQHHAFVVVRTFLRWAHRKHYLNANPMERMQSGYRYRPRERVLSNDELSEVWNAAGDTTYGSIVKLLILTGQRVGEISKLTPAMIGKDTITLPAENTKNGRTHRFPVGQMARTILCRGNSRTYLFPARGKPSFPFNGFSKGKANLDKTTGVLDWTLHDLRRTFATGLASLGVSLPVVEKLLNHVSGSFAGIVGVYQRHSYDNEMRAAMELWEHEVNRIVRETERTEDEGRVSRMNVAA
jgi:integrase